MWIAIGTVTTIWRTRRGREIGSRGSDVPDFVREGLEGPQAALHS
jgi:hypothetical protein